MSEALTSVGFVRLAITFDLSEFEKQVHQIFVGNFKFAERPHRDVISLSPSIVRKKPLIGLQTIF